MGLKKVTGLGQPGDPAVSTSAGGLTAASQLATLFPLPVVLPLPSIDLQPRLKEVRSNVGGFGPGASTVMTLNHLLVSEPSDTLSTNLNSCQ